MLRFLCLTESTPLQSLQHRTCSPPWRPLSPHTTSSSWLQRWRIGAREPPHHRSFVKPISRSIGCLSLNARPTFWPSWERPRQEYSFSLASQQKQTVMPYNENQTPE